MSEKLFCPIITRSKGYARCLERDCAWWKPVIGECSVKSLARHARITYNKDVNIL